MKDTYTATIGLEIHAELSTRTKMFCASRNDADEKRPNANACPVCMGHPGTLPVPNLEAVKHVLKMGLAVGGTLAGFTEFDRKNYFYPDIPKGYQISQYAHPLVSGGTLAGIAITRIHLEEDTAKSTHDAGDMSLVDFNRAGVPLMELVTEPVIRNAEQAVAFAKELQLLLRYLHAGHANMEKGEMRVEANISVSKTDTFGTKTEVKNLNSFKVVEKAINFEIARQIAVLEEGGKVVQETRGWDDAKGETYSQRAKESSHDYRYFPDPDIPKLDLREIPALAPELLRKEMCELPWERRARFETAYGMKPVDAEVFVGDLEYASYFDALARELAQDPAKVKLASNYFLSDYLGLLKKDPAGGKLEKVNPRQFAPLIAMVSDAKLSSRGAKDLLAILYAEGGDPEAVAEARGLIQKNDPEAFRSMLAEIIAANPKVLADWKAGKEASLQFFIGQGMKASRGSANPEVLKKTLLELLK